MQLLYEYTSWDGHEMLTLATNSIPIIKKLTGSAPDPDQAGVRIADGEDADSLSVRVCPAPEAGDVVLLHGGARVFLAAETSPRLEHLELYAVAKNGDVHLALREHVMETGRDSS